MSTTSTSTANAPIVFILDNVADHQSMADGLYASYEVHVLSAEGDALAQMASILDGRSGIEAIHLVSHGSAGQLDLGTTQLNAGNLADHSASLSLIRASLSPDADFLIYGCDVAKGEVGEAFVQALADATGADVAASDDATGPAASGSDADLEVQSGSIEAESLDQGNFQTLLTTAPVFSDDFGLLTTYNDSEASDAFGPITGTLTADDDETASNSLTFSGTGSSAFGQLTVEINGDFTFTPNAQAIDAMVAGQAETVTFSVSVADGEGLSASKDLTINLVGANDAPVITNAGGDLAIEEIAGGANLQFTGSLSGSFGINDVDAASPTDETDVIFGLPEGGTDEGGSAYAVGQYGALYLEPGNGDYVYYANAAQIDSLAEGQVVTDVYQVSATDALGATGLTSFTVTLTGRNDAPVITVGSPTFALIEDGGLNNEVLGVGASRVDLFVNDVDGEATWDLGWLQEQGWTLDQGETSMSKEGTYGLAVLSLAFGTLSYMLDNSAQATQALTDGQSVTEAFVVRVGDGLTTTNATVSFAITGSDDLPSVVVEQPQSLLVEDGESSGWTGGANLSGVLSLVDVDGGQGDTSGARFRVDGDSYQDDSGNYIVQGQVGSLFLDSLTGEYEFTPSAPAIDALFDGQTLTDTFTFSVLNVTGDIGSASFSVIATGTNDVPVITLEAPTASLVEAGGDFNGQSGHQAAQIGVLMNDAEGAVYVDIDAMQTLGWALSEDLQYLQINGQYGTAELSLGNGTMVYELDNSSSSTQALTENEAVSESFVVQVFDEHGARAQSTATFSIIGADDAAYLNVATAEAPTTYLNDDHQDYDRTGYLRIADVDTDIASYGIMSYGIAGGFQDDGGGSLFIGNFGTLAVDSVSGRFDYVADSRMVEYLSLGEVAYDVFSVTMTNGAGLVGSASFEVQLVGVEMPVEY